MAGTALPLIGGPLCGRGCGWRRPWAFFGALGPPTLEPGENTPHLYRLIGPRYVYAGHSHARCDGCGGFHARLDERGRRVRACTMCGERLGREPARG